MSRSLRESGDIPYIPTSKRSNTIYENIKFNIGVRYYIWGVCE